MKRSLLLLFTFVVAAFARTDKAPDWVMELSTRQLPQYPPDARVAVLLDEEHLTVDGSGSVHRETRYAIRILNEEGRKEAVAGVPYFAKKTKIRELKAWLVTDGGAVRAYGKESLADIAVTESYVLYDDVREQVINGHSPPVGSTFAWESVSDEPELLATEYWGFQERDPVLISRMILTLPAGWEAKATLFNSDAVKPIQEGTTYTWELRDLPFIKREERTPSRLGAWIGISFYPNTGSAALQLARTWTDISTFQTKLVDGQADSNDAMAAKVRELTQGAQGDFARIRAIGEYVQKTKYVAIETNLARGGGYQPHLATEVFQKNYGDCKDKANLMRAMLKIAGLDSYLVAVFAGDPYGVEPNWPSPEQFNHMIIAVKAPAGVEAASIVTDPELGRLLIFDPTNSHVPAGNIPRYEEGSYGLVLAGPQGKLIKLPVAPDEADRTNVQVEATLAPTGALSADVAVDTLGDSAAFFRELYAEVDNKRATELVERWVSYGARRCSVNSVQPVDAFENNRFALKINVSSDAYAQVMQRGRMLILKPDVIARFDDFDYQSDARVSPYVLDPECYHKTVKVKLPEGFTVDQMPSPAQISTKYGKFASTYKIEGGQLIFTEDLDVKQAVVPAADYAQLKSFFAHVNGAERQPLLLVHN